MLPDSQTHLASQLSVESTSSSATPTSSDTKPQIKRPKIIKRRGANQVDWLGAMLITVGLVLLTFSLGDGETAKPNQWKSPYIIVLLILSVLIIGVFVWWEARLGGWKDVEDEDEVRKREEQNENRRGEETDGDQMGSPDELEKLEPLLKLSIFGRANGKLIAMAIVAFFVWAAFGGWSLYAVVSSFTLLAVSILLFFIDSSFHSGPWLHDINVLFGSYSSSPVYSSRLHQLADETKPCLPSLHCPCCNSDAPQCSYQTYLGLGPVSHSHQSISVPSSALSRSYSCVLSSPVRHRHSIRLLIT